MFVQHPHLRRSFSAAASIFMLASCLAVSADAQVATRKARFYFNFGDAVDIEFYGNESPLHVANFFDYANATTNNYDNTYIHRSAFSTFNTSTRFFQGGSFYLPASPNLNNLASESMTPGSPVVNEFNASNGLSNTAGSLAAARTSDPDSATSGWFINITNNANGFDPGPYTVFGQVTKGLDFLNLVAQQPLLGQVFTDYSSAPYGTAPLINGESLFVLTEVLEVSVVDGDYTNNGTVNAGDLNLWTQDFGNVGFLDVDGDGDRQADGGDFLLFQQNFGASGATPAVVGVPEPTSLLLAIGGAAGLAFRRFFRRRES